MTDKKYIHYELYVPFSCLTDDVKLEMEAVLKDFKVRSKSIQCGKIEIGYVFIIGLGEDRQRAELFKSAMSKAVNREECPPISEREETTDETWETIKRCQVGIRSPLKI